MVRVDRARRLAILLSVASLAHPRIAHAQLSGTLEVASDDRWRGRSLSAGRPVASAAIAYDLPSGGYVDAAATTVWTHDSGVALLGAAVDAGYAWRTARGLAIDVGATRQQFTRHFSGGRPAGYSEIYGGVSGRAVAARLSYSPDYFVAGNHTLYARVDAVTHPATDWRINAHAGAIAYLSPIRVAGLRTIEYDYGIGLARRLRSFELRLDLTSGGPDPDYFRGRTHGKSALVASVTKSF